MTRTTVVRYRAPRTWSVAIVGALALSLAFTQVVFAGAAYYEQAAVAVGHRILICSYHLLQREEDYHELAPLDLAERRCVQLRTRVVWQLRQLGFEVTLIPKGAAAWPGGVFSTECIRSFDRLVATLLS